MLLFVGVVQLLSRVWLFVTPWPAARQAPLSSTASQSLLKLMFIESVMPSNYLTLCRPLLLLPWIFPSIRIFCNELTLQIRWPKYWSLISLQPRGLSRVFSSTTIWNRHFFSPQPSLWSNSHLYTWLLEKPQPWLYRPLSTKWCLCF